ncbi:MAG: hypothetical protein LBJ04_21855 [Sphingobacterium sp.]|jgi:hypothetical protein|uniref:hypothetical protein n=1 Tax=Sphingobacterium sp. TaxID=341027 RepID=UPI00282C7F62|nr:hypothetical protein [Sphingobacterium sp.]MDR0265873.1 hypothetical protein [Sphingobacterium sp.]
MFRRAQYTDYLLVYNKRLNTSEVIEARKAPHTDLLTIVFYSNNKNGKFQLRKTILNDEYR